MFSLVCGCAVPFARVCGFGSSLCSCVWVCSALCSCVWVCGALCSCVGGLAIPFALVCSKWTCSQQLRWAPRVRACLGGGGAVVARGDDLLG
ncbi:hypothetical protein BJ741DRAFT_423346 [Chytriomyces cf. hyalinus JEL632]|nr:hypothetical protein BJ741DRAFT_423346 [Chytriomyces cf. hyalinus JEL632]